MRLFASGGRGWRWHNGISNNNGVYGSGFTNGHNIGGTYVVLALVVGLLVTMVTGARDGSGGEGGGDNRGGVGGGNRRPRDAGTENGAGVSLKEQQSVTSPERGEREIEQVVEDGEPNRMGEGGDDGGAIADGSNDIMLDLNKLARIGNKDKLLSMLKQIADSIHKCGVKEVPLLKRHFITNHTVTCNDGSPAG